MGSAMKRLEFHISYSCINDCIFCSEHDQLAKFKNQFVGSERIAKELERFSGKGFNHVTFTGGEPSFHPDFIRILRLSRQLGFKTYATTNGGLFSSKRFCWGAFPYLDEICFSVHGHNAKLHNLHTRNAQSFAMLLRALKNTEECPRDIFVFINIVVTKYNYDFVDKIIGFLSRYNKIKQVLISNLAPEGRGLSNFKELAVPLGKMEALSEKIVSLSQANQITARFFGLPLCQLKGREDFSNDLHWASRATLEQWKGKKVFLKSTLSYAPVRRRMKPSKCGVCLKKDICAGVFKKYYQEFGGKDLTPFKK